MVVMILLVVMIVTVHGGDDCRMMHGDGVDDCESENTDTLES